MYPVTEGLYLAWPDLRGCFLLLGSTGAKPHPSWFVFSFGWVFFPPHFTVEAYQSGLSHCSPFPPLCHTFAIAISTGCFLRAIPRRSHNCSSEQSHNPSCSHSASKTPKCVKLLVLWKTPQGKGVNKLPDSWDEQEGLLTPMHILVIQDQQFCGTHSRLSLLVSLQYQKVHFSCSNSPPQTLKHLWIS